MATTVQGEAAFVQPTLPKVQHFDRGRRPAFKNEKISSILDARSAVANGA